MKIKLLGSLTVISLLSIVCVGVGCHKDNPGPAKPSIDLKKGLLLYLPFNGSFADSSGNANPSTPINGATLSYDEHGYANSAFGATGNGERLIVNNNGSIKFDTAFTVSFNVMVLDQRNQMFMALVEYDNAHGYAFNCGLYVPGNEQFEFGASDISRRCDTAGDNNSNNVADSTGFRIANFSWYNIICLYHRATISTYINGKLVSTKKGTGTLALNCPNAQFIIGGWWQNGGESMNGRIDEVRFYNRLLNADEIAELSKDFQQ